MIANRNSLISYLRTKTKNYSKKLDKLNSYLNSLKTPFAIIITGSFAKMTDDEFSDIDLFILYDESNNPQFISKVNIENVFPNEILWKHDISYIIPASEILFFSDGIRMHITYSDCVRFFTCHEKNELCVFSSTISDINSLLTLVDRKCISNNEFRNYDERILYWLLQGSYRLKRGELWSSYCSLNMIYEYLSSILSDYLGVKNEGSRRIEMKFEKPLYMKLYSFGCKPKKTDMKKKYIELLTYYLELRTRIVKEKNVEMGIANDVIKLIQKDILLALK